MQDKYMENINSMGKKGVIGITTEIPVPARLVALVAGAGESLVKKVRDGDRITGRKAVRIAKADELLQKGMNDLVEKVRSEINK